MPLQSLRFLVLGGWRGSSSDVVLEVVRSAEGLKVVVESWEKTAR